MINKALWAGIKRKIIEEKGAGIAEYALLLFVVAMAGAAILATFGGTVVGIFQQAETQLPAEVTPVDPGTGTPAP